MRLTNKASQPDRMPACRWALAIGLIAALGACGRAGEGLAVAASADNGAGRYLAVGPAGDYPVVLGEPYSIDGQLYTPADTMSYDEVGYAAFDNAGGAGVTAAHKTLPLPSYIEITSLVTGKTILARVERRGPMTGDRLVALSPGARAQLGIADGAPVRVRRVNAPETERAKLRLGYAAAQRMETPPSLVAVLKRKLPERGSADLGLASLANLPRATPLAAAPVDIPPSAPAIAPEEIVAAEAADAQTPVAPSVSDPVSKPAAVQELAADRGKFVVQAATFSNRASADRIASSLGGFVLPAGKYFRVRVGPFTSRGQADAALAKVRAAGYSDASVTVASVTIAG